MKKLTIKLEGIEMLTKEQMKKISGSYGDDCCGLVCYSAGQELGYSMMDCETCHDGNPYTVLDYCLYNSGMSNIEWGQCVDNVPC